MKRNETLKLMDQLEALVLKKGWPVPFSPFYLVHHERMLHLLDQLRAQLLKDHYRSYDLDERFIQAFTQDSKAIRRYRISGEKLSNSQKGEMSH